jgi:CelD/BcsL family acetyltransferase involved in cellulose biosynthesis
MMADTQGYTVDLVEHADWDDLVRCFPQHTVFHSMAWLQSISAAYGLSIVLCKAMSGGRCVAVWPYLRLRKGLLTVLGSPLPGWSTSYLGPLFAPDADVPSVLAAFFNHRAFRGYAYFACKVIDNHRRIDLHAFGFSVVLKYQTYRLDLGPEQEQLWSNCRRECRNHIRKAQKLGVTVRPETSPDFINEYWRMSLETFAKANVQPTHNKQLIEELWTNRSDDRSASFLSAFHEEKRVATLVLLADDHTMYYWGGASFMEFRHLSAHNLLQWEAICEAKRRKLQTYDFISTTGGPGRFKESFGPQVVDIATHWERSPSKLMGALKHHYERYLRRRQRLAASVANL